MSGLTLCVKQIDDQTEHYISTLKHWVLNKNGYHFADNIFKCNFLQENVFHISLLFDPKGAVVNTLALVQASAWSLAS